MAIEFSQIKSTPRVVKSAQRANVSDVSTSAAADIHDVAEVSEAPRHGGFLAALGGGLLVALSLGGTLTAPAMAAPAAITQSTASTYLAPLSDAQAKDILGKMPGLKNTSFSSHLCLWCSFDAGKALDRLNHNGAVDVPRPGQADDRINNKEQLAELAAMRGLYPNGGVSNGIVHAMQVGHFSQNGSSLSDYQAFDALRHGQSVSDSVGGRSYTLSNPLQAQELNALEGDGQNSTLSSEVTTLIKHMAEQVPGEGLFQNGHRLNAYEYLQAAQAGQPVTYQFTGGPYHEAMSLRAPLGDLANVAHTVANQHAADSVRPSQRFFNAEMQKLNEPLTNQVNADAQRAQSLIDGGNADLQRYTAIAAQEAQAVTNAQSEVDAAQANLDQVMPGWQAASQRANDLQHRVDFLGAASVDAHNQEGQASQAYQAAQQQVAAAQQLLQQVLNPAPSQAPADPDAAPAHNGAPVDPDAAPAAVHAHATSSAPADPDAAPSDPDAGSVSNLQIAQKAQAQAAVRAAQQQVGVAYQAMTQAITNRVTADIALQQMQSQLPSVQDDFGRADVVKSRAERALQDARDDLDGHATAQARAQQGLQNAQAQIQQGQAALESAHQLQSLSAHYLKAPDAQTLHQMAGLASNADLKANLARQQQLFEAMTRPTPPPGYSEPTPLVYSEQ